MILRFSTLFRHEPKRAQAALGQTENQLRRALKDDQAVMAGLGEGIYTVDAGGLVTYLNPAAEHLFGWSTVELLGRNMHDVTHQKQPDGRPLPAGAGARLQVLQKDADLLFYEDMFVRKDGTLFPVVYSSSTIKSEGNIVGLAVVFRDVTAQKLTESDLRQAQAILKAHPAELEKTVLERTAELRKSVDELEAFCYSLSHDMRAPLRAIRSFTGITLEENAGQLGPEGAERLQRVINSSEHMTRLLEDVLAFSHISRQPIVRVPVEVETLLREIIQDRPELQPPQADVRIQTPLLPVLGDATSLTQCLSNLLTNAVKFVAPGVKPRVRILSEPRGGKVRLWIEDNGVGIPEEFQASIFGLFNRHAPHPQYEGSGIGLAIVRKAVQRIGGAVGVESEPGQGSRFWVELLKP